ncbi:MAG: SurA N-terminal domain-containing protein [Rhodobacteraceae bacterium]|nr:SurA N-terminal domain-containing protein [Paracoccaceae bacterium]
MSEQRKKRGKAANIFVWILLAGLIVGLAGFGITGFGGNVRSIGSVGDRDLSIDDYFRELQGELRVLSTQAGRAVTLSEARQFAVDQRVLDRLITLGALDNEAAQLGLSVGDEVVRDEIVRNPAFTGPAGQFDRTTYDFALSQAGFTATQFEEALREESARGLLEAAVVTGLVPSRAQARVLLAHMAEGRSFSWAVVDASRAGRVTVEPSDADLRAFHEANPERFTLPAAREIAYASITPERMIDRIEIPEEDLRNIYESERSRFDQPERRIVDRLPFSNETAAREALRAIQAGETDFDALVEQRGLDFEDVELGEVARNDLPSAQAEAIFAAEGTGVIGPVSTPLGPSLFQINAILDAQVIPFEEAREELAAEWGISRAARVVADMVDPVDDLLAGGATLEELAAETEMEFGRISFFDGMREGIARDANFRDAAREARQGAFPELLELSDGGLFALRLERETPPRLQPFEEVREEVAAAWAAAEQQRRIEGFAEGLRVQLAAGVAFEDLGLTRFEAVDFPRDGSVEGAPRAFVAEIFRLDAGETILFPIEGAAILARLDAIVPFDAGSPENADILEAVEAQLARGIAQDTFALFADALKSSAGVSLDQSAINAVHAQFN